MIRRSLLPMGLAMLLAGCMPGPRHVDPRPSLAPTPAGNASLAPVTPASGAPQHFVAGGRVPADWWRAFGNADLDVLITRALAANNDLQSADAALAQAREQARAAGAALLPQADLSYNASRQRVSRIYSNPLQDPNNYAYSLQTAQLAVSYPLDLFGLNRSRRASARSAAEVQAARLRAARTTMVTNLVQAVIQQASLRDQIVAATQAVQVNRDVLQLIIRRQQVGALGLADVAAQQTALATFEQVLPPLQRALLHQQALIAALIGEAPGNPLPPLPALDQLRLPPDMPAALPSELVAHRPDIQAAAAQMQGAAADVGAAIAARLPQITLSATVGGVATGFGEMFADGNPFWTLIGGVAQPLFHGGQLLHQERAARAALTGAQAQYRAAVLQAFVDVSDALAGLHTDGDALDAASRASAAAAQNLQFVRRQAELGQLGTLNLLNATSANAQAQSQRVQAEAARLADSVALFQALGGGWEEAR